MNKLGDNIKFLRKQKKWSQKELGDMIGASQTSVAHYEKGTRQPTIETLIMLSEILNEDIDTLIGTKRYTLPQIIKGTKLDNIHEQLLEALIKKDDRRFFELFTNHVLGVYPIEVIFGDILTHILYEIGSNWIEGTINEADEHYATNTIRKLISYISIINMDIIKDRKAITFSTSSDRHTIGIEMVNTYLESLGIQSIYLGNNLPYRSIEQIVREVQPDYIFISITMRDYLNSLSHLVDFLNDRFGEELTIVIGGQGFRFINELESYNNLYAIQTLDDLKEFIKSH